VQYGVFSPILRLHCTSNPYHERRPWGRGPAAERAATQAMRLRHALIPYLYSMAWRNTQSALPLVTPMYYSHPESPEAYQCPQQYWFGSELVAAPFTRPSAMDTGLASQSVWLPVGEWFHFFTGERMPHGWQVVYGDLDDTPVFARGGAIVPLGEPAEWSSTANPATLHLYVFPGSNGSFDLYEDDGQTMEYTRGKFAQTGFLLKWESQSMRFSIAPASGDRSVLPALRTYVLHFRGIEQPDQAAVRRNGGMLELAASYDSQTATFSLAPITLAPMDELVVDLSTRSGGLVTQQDRSLANLSKYLRHFRLDSWIKADIEKQLPQLATGEVDLHAYRALSAAQLSALQGLLAANKDTG
jgi:hypothetical protein